MNYYLATKLTVIFINDFNWRNLKLKFLILDGRFLNEIF